MWMAPRVRVRVRRSGVLLCDGVQSDGVLAAEFVILAIELKNGLSLKPEQLWLLQGLFPKSSKVRAPPSTSSRRAHLHNDRADGALDGGRVPSAERTSRVRTAQVEVSLMNASVRPGCMVLRTESFDLKGRVEEPTLTMLGSKAAITQEADRISTTAGLVGSDAATRVQQGPLYVASGGESTLVFGALLLETPGACWALPDFNAKMLNRVELLVTFGKQLGSGAPRRETTRAQSRRSVPARANAGACPEHAYARARG